jgi:transforming growth factor-beta-induced protein
LSTQDQTTIQQGTGVNDALKSTRIWETAVRIPEISRFVEAIRKAEYANDLQAPDWRTLFAPSNEALEKADNWEQILNDSEKLEALVGRHITHGRQTEADLRTTKQLRPLAGEPVPVEYKSSGSRYGNATIIRRDIPCENGTIQILDGLAVTA